MDGEGSDVLDLIQELERKAEENSDRVSYDFEINDYPQYARGKAMNKDFLASVIELYNVTI